MIDLAAARTSIAEKLATLPAPPGDAWVILDECTIERRWGWVFFYDSCRHHETRDLRFAVAGNAPYFVRKSDGAIFISGTAFPVESYIEDFESGGRLANRCS